MSIAKKFSGFASDWRRGLAIAVIKAYQRWISPRKGFRCAHRVLHGGPSCSQFVKVAIATRPWPEALQRSRLRFAACGQAKRQLRILRSQLGEKSQSQEGRNPGRRKPHSNWCEMFVGGCCEAGGTSSLECGASLIPDCTEIVCGDCGCDVS